ncbi:MAG: hypothetical protein JSS66_06945 [Armatimonadetes bacterium]|nr:hypothetical protein [Armatimonadota bacterium]
MQCGDEGIVFTGKGDSIETKLSTPEGQLEVVGLMFGEEPTSSHYKTAFFEAFPKEPATFLRGEGNTVEEAEASAWNQLQKHIACPGHEWEKRGYKNGAGFCKHCGLFKSKVFEPDEDCYLCGQKTYHGQTNDGRWYCKKCQYDVPEELLPCYVLDARKYRAECAARGEPLPEYDEDED